MSLRHQSESDDEQVSLGCKPSRVTGKLQKQQREVGTRQISNITWTRAVLNYSYSYKSKNKYYHITLIATLLPLDDLHAIRPTLSDPHISTDSQ